MSLFGIYSAPGVAGPRHARHTQASRRVQPPASPRSQRTFAGARGGGFNRSVAVVHMSGELARKAEARNYYRGNVQLVGESHEPLRALR